MPSDSVTFDYAGAKITLSAAALATLWISQLQQQRAGARPLSAPARAIGARWAEQGGIYAGVARGRSGDRDHHLVVADDEQSAIRWQAAMDWAKGLEAAGDWSLPTRAESALLFANVPELFQKEMYWTCEEYAGGAQYAWFQTFYDGSQGYGHKGNELRARAVRRVPIE